MNAESRSRQKEALVLIENLLDQEEIFWLQRGRANWLMHGDRNTSFFHNAATARKKRNNIKKLLDDTGVWRQGAELKNHIRSYFSNLFTSEVGQPNMEVLSLVRKRVSDEMNNALLAPYTVDDVRKALFDIGDLKAPGPDGLHAIFYKIFQPMLGDDLVQEVPQAVNTCTIPEGCNVIAIVMIPKINSPDKVTQFRLMLCTKLYPKGWLLD